MACETLAEAFVQMNRYSRLVVEIDGVITSGDRFVLRREGGQFWLIDTRKEWLTLRSPLTSRYVFGTLSERADDLLKSLQSSKSTHGRVQTLRGIGPLEPRTAAD